MAQMQYRPAIGRIRRSAPARIAGDDTASAAQQPNLRARRRLPLFAQFPPASLFKAIGRAVSRRAIVGQAASGTGLANSRLWHDAGGS